MVYFYLLVIKIGVLTVLLMLKAFAFLQNVNKILLVCPCLEIFLNDDANCFYVVFFRKQLKWFSPRQEEKDSLPFPM